MRSLTWSALAVGTALCGASLAAVASVLARDAPPIADVAAFWRAGRWVVAGRPGDLYPASSFGGSEGGAFKGFLNPPHVAVLFAPLGHASLRGAALVFAAVNVAVGALLLVMGWRFLRGRGVARPSASAFLLLAAGSASVGTTFANGTSSLLAAAAVALLIAGDRRDDVRLAAVAIALLSWKPQYAIVPMAYLLARRRFRLVAWGSGLTLASMVMTLPFTGLAPWRQYVPFLDRYAATLDIWHLDDRKELWLPRQMLNVRALLIRSLGVSRVAAINLLAIAVVLTGAVIAVLVARRVARGGIDVMIGWSVICALMIVTSQHANVGDGIVLFIALALAMGAVASGGTTLRSDRAGLALAGALALDVATLIGNAARVDPSVPWSALAAISLAVGLLVLCVRGRVIAQQPPAPLRMVRSEPVAP